MLVKSGQVWTGNIVCKDATGALATPSVGPTGTLYVNGTANGATVTITGSNPYKWSVTLPSLSAGDTVGMYITATISGIATAAIVEQASADTKRVSDLVDAAAAPSAASVASQVRTELATELGRIDQNVSTAKTLTSAYDAAKAAASQSSVNAIAVILSGITSLAKWLQALARKSTPDATALSEINSGGGTFNAATDSQEAIRDVLNNTNVAVRSVGSGGVFTVYRDSLWEIPITGMGDISDRTKLYFTAKGGATDATALCQIEETAGLLVFAGAAYGTPTHGSFTVTDEINGDGIVRVWAVAAVSAPVTSTAWDVKKVTASGSTNGEVLVGGQLTIQATPTRATS